MQIRNMCYNWQFLSISKFNLLNSLTTENNPKFRALLLENFIIRAHTLIYKDFGSFRPTQDSCPLMSFNSLLLNMNHLSAILFPKKSWQSLCHYPLNNGKLLIHSILLQDEFLWNSGNFILQFLFLN